MVKIDEPRLDWLRTVLIAYAALAVTGPMIVFPAWATEASYIASYARAEAASMQPAPGLDGCQPASRHRRTHISRSANHPQ